MVAAGDVAEADPEEVYWGGCDWLTDRTGGVRVGAVCPAALWECHQGTEKL